MSVSSEDGADLESIEAVANEVLQMQMPTTPAQLQNLTAEIRERVGSLTDVEDILNQSANDIIRAESLLEQARKARSEMYSIPENRLKQLLPVTNQLHKNLLFFYYLSMRFAIFAT